jgi:hypothetical protein
MADYSPISVTEKDVRNFVTPALDYDDVSKAEILLKIEAVETFVSQYFFNGGTIPTNGRIAVLLLTVVNLISSPALARKYRTLASESLGDYSYTISQPMSRGSNMNSDPFAVTKTWHQMAMDILYSLSSENNISVYKVNE